MIGALLSAADAEPGRAGSARGPVSTSLAQADSENAKAVQMSRRMAVLLGYVADRLPPVHVGEGLRGRLRDECDAACRALHLRRCKTRRKADIEPPGCATSHGCSVRGNRPAPGFHGRRPPGRRPTV